MSHWQFSLGRGRRGIVANDFKRAQDPYHFRYPYEIMYYLKLTINFLMDILSNIPTGGRSIPLFGLANTTLMPDTRLHSVVTKPALGSPTAGFAMIVHRRTIGRTGD